MWTVETVTGAWEDKDLKVLAHRMAKKYVEWGFSSVPGFVSIRDENDVEVGPAEVSAFYDEVEALAIEYKHDADAENEDYDSLTSSRYM